jgi:hypothetical protein
MYKMYVSQKEDGQWRVMISKEPEERILNSLIESEADKNVKIQAIDFRVLSKMQAYPGEISARKMQAIFKALAVLGGLSEINHIIPLLESLAALAVNVANKPAKE